MRRDSERRKDLQKAEYRNRKEGMETGRTKRGRARKPKGREAALEEPPTGENGKKGKERTEG